MKILIADDDADSRRILRTLLGHEGHKVEVAHNGVEALRLAKESPPDIIISDILMPVMDGFRLCHVVKGDKQLNKIPFVFYTATYTDPNDERLAMSLGASRFIVKTIDPGEFVNIIRSVFQEYEEKSLPVPEKPLKKEPELSRMYEDSISMKLDKKVKELQLYREIFINSNDAIAIIDREGFYIRQNSSHRILNGYSDEELRGKTPAIHLGDDVFANVTKTLSERGVYRGELISYTKDGRAVYIDLAMFPVTNEKGEVVCYVGSARNISDRKKMEEELKERVNQLEK